VADAPAHRFEPLPAQRLGDRVYQHLIEAIATSRLPQGARIQEDVLAEQMGVSKTPVREALRRLEAEGFISVDPHRTPEVRRLGPRDIEELYGVREFLERLAVRTITAVRPAAILAEMEAVQAEAEARLASGEPVEVAESVGYNRRFHGLIFQGAGNRRLRRLYQLIDVDVRRLSFESISVSGRRRDAVVQHRAILEAIKAGDADQAEALMIHHVQQARGDLLRRMNAPAEPASRA
jgi:DNA-binding GntR family transcriptional regulator